MRQLSLTLGSLLLLSFVACNTGPRIYHVKGTVTYKGAPLPAGVVFFDPDAKNDGPQGNAFIKDGAFDTAAKGGKGVVGKSYLVRIHGFDGKPGEELPMGKVLFTHFQESVEFPLQDSVRDFVVGPK